MKGAQQSSPIRQTVVRSVSEDKSRFAAKQSLALQEIEISIKGDPAQHQHHANVGQELDFLFHVSGAVGNLKRSRFIARGSTMHGSRDVCVFELKAVIAVQR